MISKIESMTYYAGSCNKAAVLNLNVRQQHPFLCKNLTGHVFLPHQVEAVSLFATPCCHQKMAVDCRTAEGEPHTQKTCSQ